MGSLTFIDSHSLSLSPSPSPFRKEFNIQVLQEFVRMHKFHGLDLVAALRAFLGSFQLPGEAQKIDRMMESFAQRYCDCNPGMFSNTGESVQKYDIVNRVIVIQ